MNIFETSLFQLLLKHECVVVPNFGAFVAQHRSAVISENGCITPPSKSFIFNKLLKLNDGLLIDHFAQNACISYENAQNAIEIELQLWNALLEQGERKYLDKIGYFVLDSNQHLYFQADITNFSLNSYGLPMVSFTKMEALLDKHITEVLAIPAAEVNDTDNDFSPIISFDTNIQHVVEEKTETKIIVLPRSPKRKFVRYAAAVIIGFPLAFYSYWIPTHTRVLQSGVITLNDFNPFQNKKSVSLENKSKTTIDSTYTTEVNVETPLETTLNAEKNLIPTEVKSKPAQELKESKQTKGFDLISGSFNARENAEKLVVQLKAAGMQSPSITVINNMYRVSAASSTTNEDLQPIALELSQLGIDTWILRK
jgi:nucleoid DNA-binding protein